MNLNDFHDEFGGRVAQVVWRIRRRVACRASEQPEIGKPTENDESSQKPARFCIALNKLNDVEKQGNGAVSDRGAPQHHHCTGQSQTYGNYQCNFKRGKLRRCRTSCILQHLYLFLPFPICLRFLFLNMSIDSSQCKQTQEQLGSGGLNATAS